MPENVYRKARKNAAKKNKDLKSAWNASLLLHMCREKLLSIEKEDGDPKKKTPSPEDVKEMSKIYDAPELCNYYCTKECPIGKGTAPLLQYNIESISARLMSALHSLNNVNDEIYRVLEDQTISEDEQEEFSKILEVLKSIAYNAESLCLWVKKNNFDEKMNKK